MFTCLWACLRDEKTILFQARCAFLCGQCCSHILQQSLFLESWMHLSDGSAKVVTLSHHAMRASNDASEELLYLQMSLRISPILSGFLPLTNTQEFPVWITLSARGLVRCTVLWNGSLVQQVAQHGNSITSFRDPSLRFTVPRQHQRPDSDLTWELIF